MERGNSAESKKVWGRKERQVGDKDLRNGYHAANTGRNGSIAEKVCPCPGRQKTKGKS